MQPETIIWLCLLFGIGALLYTSVGHAGASAYLAVMALFSLPAATMRPTALVLNIVVASLATYRFVRAGQFNFRLLVPFIVGAIPAAFLAGRVHLPGDYYRPLVGVVLFAAAARLLWPRPIAAATAEPRPPLFLVMVLSGIAIGVLSGLTGTGGGIFLSPLILFFAWETPRKTSGVAAAFILCVSISGLVGNYAAIGSLPPELPFFILAVVVGALAGTRLGINKLNPEMLLKALGVVLLVAGAKLTFT